MMNLISKKSRNFILEKPKPHVNIALKSVFNYEDY